MRYLLLFILSISACCRSNEDIYDYIKNRNDHAEVFRSGCFTLARCIGLEAYTEENISRITHKPVLSCFINKPPKGGLSENVMFFDDQSRYDELHLALVICNLIIEGRK